MKRRLLLGWIAAILLIVLTACGTTALATGEANSSIVAVQVTITDLNIESSLTKFAPNVFYHFIIANKSEKQHNFLLGPLIQPGMTMRDVEQQKLFGFGVIQPGETKVTNFTFKEVAPQGVLQFSCHAGNLYEPGMRLDIVVLNPQSTNS